MIVNANENLQTVYPMNGQTRRARSILSWGLHANRLQLHADLGQRAELPNPPRSISRSQGEPPAGSPAARRRAEVESKG